MPTLIELGFAGFDYYVFYGVLAPAGTPDAIVGTLNTEIDRAIATPDMRKRLAERGVMCAWARLPSSAASSQANAPRGSARSRTRRDGRLIAYERELISRAAPP